MPLAARVSEYLEAGAGAAGTGYVFPLLLGEGHMN